MHLKGSWLFPVIQSVHLTGIALLVGSVAITNLRLIGYVLPDYDIAEVTHRFAPWRRIGLVIMLATGPLLFAADVPRYASNPAFRLKMAVLAAALAFHFTIQDRLVMQERRKIAAFISITLWTCVVLGGRAIADFDV
jgi:hypothetical protein